MYDLVNLIPVAVYAVIGLLVLLTARAGGGLLCALVTSYCGVVIVSATRGTMGSVLLPQLFLLVLAPLIHSRPPMPALRSRGLTGWTYGLFFVYLLAIGMGIVRYDPVIETTMFGRFASIAGVPLSVLMAGYRLFVLTTLLLAFWLPLRYHVDRDLFARCLTLCWLFTLVLAVAGVLDYVGVANLKFDITRSLIEEDPIEAHEVILGFRRGALGTMMVMGILLSYAMTHVTTSSLLKTLAWISAPLFIVALLFTWSRAATLAMAVSALSLVITLGGARVVRGVIMSAFGLIVIWLILRNYEDLAERLIFFRTGELDPSITVRQETWAELLAYLFRTPSVLLTGVGFQNFNYALNVGEEEVRLVAAHNSYLHVLAETGIVGFVVFFCWILAIFGWLLAWRKQATDRTVRVMCGVFASVMIGVLVSALTQETLAPSSTMVPWLLHFYLVLGIWVSWYRSETSAAGRPVAPTVVK